MVNESDGDKTSGKQSNEGSSLQFDCSISDKHIANDEFSADIDDHSTPITALNTAEF